jgi:transcriptional regulator with XRE-family HTH domain
LEWGSKVLGIAFGKALLNAFYLNKGGELDSWDLKKWRKKHGFNQFEAAERLGINRGGFQNWEREVRPISRAVELACEEITRLSRQQPDFGPVILVCADGPIFQQSEERRCVALLRCDRHPNNEAAIEEAVRLKLDRLLVYAFILSEDGSVIWESAELVDECSRIRANRGEP